MVSQTGKWPYLGLDRPGHASEGTFPPCNPLLVLVTTPLNGPNAPPDPSCESWPPGLPHSGVVLGRVCTPKIRPKWGFRKNDPGYAQTCGFRLPARFDTPVYPRNPRAVFGPERGKKLAKNVSPFGVLKHMFLASCVAMLAPRTPVGMGQERIDTCELNYQQP